MLQLSDIFRWKLTTTVALLAITATSASYSKGATVTKTFKFKDDFFLRIKPLSEAIAPLNGEQLVAALEQYSESFRDQWVVALMEQTLPDSCDVLEMSVPEFSLAQWRYPDYYDIEELPTPGQSYIHPDTYVQRLYYTVESLKISCVDPVDDYPTYRDLDKDSYAAAAFSGSFFTQILNPSNTTCDGNDIECLFSTVESAEYDTFNDTNADLFVQRFMDVPMYLKCLDQDGYGPDIANVLIKAMDQYFELYVEQELESVILSNAPQGSVYNFASPFETDERVFFTHGLYYTGGNLVEQGKADDGLLITKYTYGFDVVWFWPKGATDDIIPDVPSVVNPIYDDGAFLNFLQEEYSEYDWVSGLDYCAPVDTMPDFPQVSLVPTTIPTVKPTSRSEINESCAADSDCVDGLVCHGDPGKCVCNVDTNFGCESGSICSVYEKDEVPRCYCDMSNDDAANGCSDGQVCRFSCAYLVDNPRCYDDPLERDCTLAWGDGFTCADSNNDGVIDQSDKSGGCDFKAPTAAPQTLQPSSSLQSLQPSSNLSTAEPTYMITPAPSIQKVAITYPPTITVTTPVPTPFPTLPPVDGMTCDGNSTSSCPDELCCVEDLCQECITHPDEGTKPIIGTCGNGNIGDGICAWEGYCCSQYGWCGTTAEYCEGPSNAPTPSEGGFYPAPTASLDAGKCGQGESGEGLCADPEHCCSQWGYCGPGEGYCYVVDDGTNPDGSCGGGGVGDGVCGSGQCCSEYGFCGEGAEYCTGYIDKGNITDDEEIIIESSPLPDDLKPIFGFRCGVTEVDARSNCKSECTHHIQCSEKEECWGIQLNYCNTFEQGTHPVCTNLDLADTDSRCGFDEINAREHCGSKCQSDDDCGEKQFCFPTLLNLCDCFENMDKNGSVVEVFSNASDSIKPYFLGELVAAEKPVAVEGSGEVEGIARNSASCTIVALSAVLMSMLMYVTMSW